MNEEMEWVPEGYQLIEPLARGGQGETWLARYTQSSNIMVIKRIKSGNRGLFYRELFSMVVAEHPNIVDITDYYDTPEGDRLLVMEYCQGGTLRQYMEDRLFLEATEVLGIFEQLFSAISAVHEEGLIHGDLKPENFFRHKRHGAPVWKVGDFGISRHQDDARQTKACTPAYASPEHIVGKLCCESDIYSLGCMMKECLQLGIEENYGHLENERGLRNDLESLAEKCTHFKHEERPTSKMVHNRLVMMKDYLRTSRYLDTTARSNMANRILNLGGIAV